MRTFIYLLFLVAFTGCASKQPVTPIQPAVSVVPTDKPTTPPAPTTKKIIHISDTHFGCENKKGEEYLCNQRKELKTLLDKLAKLAEQGNPSDYVIVYTGDAVNDATDYKDFNEYNEKIKPYFKKIKDTGFKILAVPGNHDYGKGGPFFEKKEYADNLKTYFEIKESFPIVTQIDNIVFIGLDSMEGVLESWLNRYYHIMGMGMLGDCQLRILRMLMVESKELNDILANDERYSRKFGKSKECQSRITKAKLKELNDILTNKNNKKVVYLHHDPFDIKESEDLIDILNKNGVSALLFGHKHDGGYNSKFCKKHDCTNIERIYNAGTSASKEAKIRVIDLSEPSSTYTVLDNIVK